MTMTGRLQWSEVQRKEIALEIGDTRDRGRDMCGHEKATRKCNGFCSIRTFEKVFNKIPFSPIFSFINSNQEY